jgi:hypothetical protein
MLDCYGTGLIKISANLKNELKFVKFAERSGYGDFYSLDIKLTDRFACHC